MCLIAFAHDAHPAYRLVLAANRDEFYDRPTAPAAWWVDAPHVLAGRDLRARGTWMGVTRDGRFAAVTNFRESAPQRPDALSRGDLVADFLRGTNAAKSYVWEVASRGSRYNGFNLLLGDPSGVFYVSNRASGLQRLPAGIYGISNHLLDTPWPKVVRARQAVAEVLSGAEGKLDTPLFEMLADRVLAADQELPDTGVGVERERLLSPPFISAGVYGTRSSTVLVISRGGEVDFVERSINPGGEGYSEARFAFRVSGGRR